MRVKNALLISMMMLALVATLAPNVSAAASLTPSSASGLVNMPASFTANGLVAAATYDIEVNDVVTSNDVIASTAGSITFTATPTVAGQNKVEVVNSTGSVVVTGYINATDLIATIIPVMTLLIGLGIVFGVARELKA